MLLPTDRREIGKTGILVSPLGFGCSPLGNEFGPIDEQDGINAVHEAVKRGINLFDVSPYYGRTKAETVLGKALRDIPREKVVLSTKVGRYDVASFDFSAERVTRSVEESMNRLNVDFIDIIYCHDVEFGDLDQIVTETLPALQKLKEAGKIRAIGISGYPLEIFPYVVTASPPGSVDVILSYCNYCLQNDRLKLIADGLSRAGVGVINAAPLSMGLLTSGGRPSHPADTETKECARRAAQLCATKGIDLAQLAIQYALNAQFPSTLIGIDSMATLEKNLRILSLPLDTSLMSEVRNVFAPVMNRRWDCGFFKAHP